MKILILLGIFGFFIEMDIIINGKKILVFIDIGFIVLIISEFFYNKELF